MSWQYVYFAVAGDMVKIGCSVMPTERLKCVQEWVPFKIQLAATMEGDFGTEADLHCLFAGDWSHREWFHLSPAIRQFIDAINAGTIPAIPRRSAPPKNRGFPNATATAKSKLTRSVSLAERHAYGEDWDVRRKMRPIWVVDALLSYAGPDKPLPSPEVRILLESYVEGLRSNPRYRWRINEIERDMADA